jgi:hypothetical protein
MSTSIKKGELKSIIKECILELIKDGSLNEMFVAATPKIQTAVAGIANPSEKQLLELAFADTAANELPKHMNAMNFDPMTTMNQFNNGMVSVPQLAQQNPWGMQQPQPWQMMPQPQMQNMMMPQQQQPSGQSMNKWAQLAFNSPIKNRPNDNNALMVGQDGFLPGQGRGRFG